MRASLRDHERVRSESRQALFAGRFEVQATLGEGASSVVYRAWDRQLKRAVALKVMRPWGAGTAARERFLREARTLAGLVHPNVVTVYDAGEDAGGLYIVMELVPGRPLSELLGGRGAELDAMVALLEKVARGLGLAHERGIVHRDVKPSNILVTEWGEPKIADFGLAKMVEPTVELTRSGATVGTPAYMAPEQAQGRVKDVSARTDVYALGVILYEMATGRRPHDGGSPEELLRRIAESDPPSPRELNPRIARAIETICGKAMQKESAARYASAREFADDLRRYLEDEAIHARPAPLASRIWRRVVRHRAVAAPLSVLAAVALGLGVYAVVVNRRDAQLAQERLAEAVRLERGDRLEEARDAYRAALALDARVVAAREGLERTAAELKRRAAMLEERPRAMERALRLLEEGRPALERARRYLACPEVSYEELVQRVDAAQSRFEQAVSAAPEMALAHHLLGRAWELKGYDDRAETCWRKAIALDPNLRPARYRLGRRLMVRAYLMTLGPSERHVDDRQPAAKAIAEEAAREMEEVTARAGPLDDPIDAELAGAMLAYVRRAYGESRALVRSAIERAEATHSTPEGLDDAHWIAGLSSDMSERLQEFERALGLCPNHVLARFSRGYTLGADPRRLRDAVADYDVALRVNPHFAPGHLNRGTARSMLGDDDGALRDFDEALKLRPDYASAYTNRGALLQARGELDRAIADYDEAIRLDPNLGGAYCNRAYAYFEKKRIREALDDFARAVELEPRKLQVRVLRGTVLLQSGDAGAALEDLDIAAELAPDNARVRCYRGMARSLVGRSDAAMEDFDAAVRLDPRLAEGYAERGAEWLRRGERARAVEDLQRALSLAPAGWVKRRQVEERLAKARTP
jgi:serine/threonine-protein kinase